MKSKELCNIANNIDKQIEPILKNIYKYLENAAKYGQTKVEIKETTYDYSQTFPGPNLGSFLKSKNYKYILKKLKNEGFSIEEFTYLDNDYSKPNYKKFLGLFEYGKPRYSKKLYVGIIISFCCGNENDKK